MNKINTVLFDFDGTIADTNELIIDSWQAVYRAYYSKEGDVDYILSTFGEPLYYSMEKAFPDHDVEETVRIYREYQQDIFDTTIKAFPGMVELLRELDSRGYKIGVVTSRLKPSTIRGAEIIGVLPYIHEMVTVEDTEIHKPFPEPALICLDKLGRMPDESIMVGDSAFDMGCGKNAGMKTVMVGWSRAAETERESVAQAGAAENSVFVPDYIIEKAEDLISLLNKLNNQ